jgi:outer membrane receptor protein involved in Fe transport
VQIIFACRRSCLHLTLLALLTVLSASANANHLYSMSLADLLQVEIEGSTRSSENIGTVPSAVTVFTREQIQQLGVSSVDELLNLVPGMQVRRNPVSGIHNTATARGRSITSSSNEIAVFHDGVRILMPFSGGPTPVLTLPVQHIERIEVIRGPGSAVYGAGAMLAVVNIVSRQNQNELQLETGSFEQLSGGLLAGGRWREWQLGLSAADHRDQGDEYQLRDSFTGAPVTATDPWQKSHLQLQAQNTSTSVGMMLIRQETEGFYTVQNLAPDVNFTDSFLNLAYAKHRWFMGRVDALLTVSHTQAQQQIHAQLSAPGALATVSDPASDDALIGGTRFDSEEWRLQWHNQWSFSKSSEWQFGVEWLEQSADDAVASNNFDMTDIAQRQYPVRYYDTLEATTLVQSKAQNQATSLYSQYITEPTPGMRFTLGARYDYHKDFGGEFSPRLGWVQEINRHHSLKLLYGQAYRTPVFNETNLENNPVLLGNPDLAPESVDTWDLIWVANGPHSLLQLGYFESRFDNAIVETPLVDTPNTRQITNADHGPIKGLEGEIRYQLSRWEFYASLTHLLEAPDLTFREAENTAGVNLDYQQDRWNLSFTSLYHGARETPSATAADGRDTLPSYWSHAAKLSFRWNKHLETYGRINNFTDEDYYSPGQSQTVRDGVPHRGRNWQLGVVWQLDEK